MRSARSLLILVVILAALGAYIYFVESKKPQGAEANLGPKIFDVKAEEITDLVVKSADGDQTTLKKVDGNWQITAPVSARADQTEVSSVLTNIATVDNMRGVDDNVSDFAQFGLGDPPRIELAFKTAKDKDFRRLQIGDKTAAMGDLYARLPHEKKVFLVAASFEATFNKGTFDLRDKSVLTFDRDKVDRVILEADAVASEVARAGGEWNLAKPLQAPADYGTVEGLIGRLQTAQMKAVVTQEASNLAEYGLDKPAGRASVVSGSGTATLLLGKAADAGTVYAKDAARPLIFTVESSLLDEIKKPATDLRRKDVFAFRSYTATSVDITRGTETLSFEKSKPQGDPPTEKWRQTRPASKDVDAAQFDTFLAKLSSLRAESFVEHGTVKTGLETPVMVVAVRFDEGKQQEKVSFGRQGTDVYASVPGQPTPMKISGTEFDDILKALDALK